MIIKFNNVRAASIEHAVEELSLRDNLPTMKDVREFMDEFKLTKIPTGKVKTYTDPNGDKVEYEEKKPIMELYNYVPDEKEIFSQAQANWLNNDNHFFSKKVVSKDAKLSEALRELKRAGWTIRADSVEEFTKQVFNILDYIQNKNRHQENIYIHSSVEGNGKSTLKNKLLDAFKEAGAKVDSASWPTGSYSDTTPFSRNSVVGIDDTGWSTIKDINEDQIKAILRRENSPTLSCNVKYQPTMMIKPRAVVIGCGNVKPPKADDRTWRIIETNSITVDTAMKDLRLRNLLEESLDSYFFILQRINSSSKILRLFFEKLLLKDNNNNKDFSGSGLIILDPSMLSPVVELLSFIQKYKSCAIDFTRCSLNDFFNMDDSISKELKYKLTVVYSKTLKYLYSQGHCKRLTYGDDLYAKFDITQLMEVDIEALATQEEVSMSAVDEVLRTLKKWDELIALAEQLESENPDDDNDLSEGEKDMTIGDEVEDEVESEPTVEEEPETQEVEEGQPISNVEDLFRENDIFEYKEDDMVEGVLKTNYRVYSTCTKTKKGLKVMVLKFKDKKTGKEHAKYYFIYDKKDPSQILANRDTNQFITDVKQIWFSRGRDLNDDVEWVKFTERMLLVMKGKQQLCISAYLELKNNNKNPYFVDAIYLPEDYDINQEVRK